MKRFLFLVLILAVALPAVAQNPTGTLTGRVFDDKGEALPGVTVTVASPSLQGTRTAVTSVNGDYIFRFLPPGDYSVRFELQGFATLEMTSKKISAAQISPVDAEMRLAALSEEVTVTGSMETISQSSQVATTVTYDLMNKLTFANAVGNSMNNYAALAAGTTSTGPSNAVTISGAMSYENLFLVNGVAIMDNLRNTPTALYIEDAVEESTTSTASVSAEYGRFSGGVVNMLTKSGGNQLKGSYRLSLDNQTWEEPTPLTVTRSNETNKTHQATLGGFILRDRLWFFAAGRLRELEETRQTGHTLIPFVYANEDTRYEGKLTMALSPNHRVVGSYIDYLVKETNSRFQTTVMDLASLYDRELPSTLLTGNYTGVITDNFFVEGQYSKKSFTFDGGGSLFTDKIYGTLMLDRSRNSARFWSPTFCGICENEERNNENYILKGSYFLSTAGLGTHDIVVGFDQFDDIRKQMNHQSGSDYRIYVVRSVINPTSKEIYPVFMPGTNTYFYYQPILQANIGTSFTTQSFFVNDKWRLNNNLSFNLGVRYDRNDGQDGEGKTVADDAKVSPRLGVSWDPKGDGEWLVNAGYAKYSTAIANNVADSTSSAGNPATWAWYYNGDPINDQCQTDGTNCLGTAQALAQFWTWFDSIGGIDNTSQWAFSPNIPGGNSRINKTLKSPSADEMTVGLTKRFGSSGMVRVDLVHREFSDFYATRLDLGTGDVVANNITYNLRLYQNEDNLLERTYDALQTSFSYRLTRAFSLGGNYTLSRLQGNFVGETQQNGPVSSAVLEYPEYRELRWWAPKGDLEQDQRHKARLWLVYDVLSSRHHTMSVSLMQSFFSGTPYGSNGTIALRNASNQPYVTNPGYLVPPTTTTYWFENRDTYRTANVTRTDLAINYAFKLPAFGTDLQFFVQPSVINIFNEHKAQLVNQTIYTGNDSGRGLTRFNPFQDTPTECQGGYNASNVWVCQGSGNWMKGPDFGNSTTTGGYQTPRTFTVSLGVRF